MLTFHWSELLVIVVGGLVLFFGLALLMLRRRSEILEKFLTPEEPELEEDFFRVRQPSPAEVPPEDDVAQTETTEAAEESNENTVQWGGVSS